MNIVQASGILWKKQFLQMTRRDTFFLKAHVTSVGDFGSLFSFKISLEQSTEFCMSPPKTEVMIPSWKNSLTNLLW